MVTSSLARQALALGALVAIAATCSIARADTTMCAGLFRPANGAHAAWIGKPWNEFLPKWQELEKKGLRMTDFETYERDGTRLYAGIFEAGTYSPAAWIGKPWNEFFSKWRQFEKSGYRLKDLEVYTEGGKTLFSGIFEPGTWAPAAYIGREWNDFQAEWTKLEAKNYRMYDLETWVENGKRLYGGLFKPGTHARAALVGVEGSKFLTETKKLEKQGMRLFDLEVYGVGNQRRYAALFQPGKGGHAAWIGRDWENFSAQWHSLEKQGLQLFDLELYPSACDGKCANTVVMPPCKGDPNCGYDYQITASATHCETAPGTCSTAASAPSIVHYLWPVDVESGERYLRVSAVDFSATPFLTLPFKGESSMSHNGWRYGDGTWHHAVDYSTDPMGTFKVRAAAAGTVVHVGWDNWSGNTVVVSHTVDGVADAFRTISMHLRAGASNDCDNAWTRTIPMLGGTNLSDYTAHLKATGCTKDKASRDLKSANWGSNESIAVAVGATVSAGDVLAQAGETGPGGSRSASAKVNTHLHIFFARRDLTDQRWYLIDPYGIYGKPECYPKGMHDAINTPCARYPVLWKGNKPQDP